VTATTPAQFSSDLANLQAGDELDVQPMTIPGSVNIRNALSAPAEIHFAPGVYFSGASQYAYNTVQISGARNLRLYGGDITGPMGPCVRVQDSTNVLWWHFKIHDCAGTGLMATTINANNTGLDFDGEITHCGLDLTLDPHAEKGTGLHGAYLGATWNSTAYTTSGKFSLYVHDQPAGAAISAGSNLSNSEIWLQAANLSFQAQTQVAGNAIQFWGDNVKNVVVHEVTGDNLAGRVVETNGMYSCCDSNIVVEYGRGTNTLQNPLLSRVNYATNPAVSYQDVAPLP